MYSKNGIIHSIYKINLRALFESEKLEVSSIDISSIKQMIEKRLELSETQEEKVREYKEVKLDSGVNAIMYLSNTPSECSEFKDFIRPIAANEEELLEIESKHLSSILFIWTTKNLYAVTTGFGRYEILPFIEKRFGMNFLSEYKEEIYVSGRTVKPISGIVHSQSEYYSQDLTVNNIVTSNDVISKIVGKINKEVLKKDIRDLPQNKDLFQVMGVDYIRLGVKLSFDKLYDFLCIIDEKQNMGDKINIIKHVIDDSELWKEVSDSIFKNDVEKYDVYIYPAENIDVFLNSTRYDIKYGRKLLNKGKQDIAYDSILQICQNHAKEIGRFDLNKYSVTYYLDEKPKPVKLASLLNASGLERNKKSYALINGDFFEFSNQFKTRVQEEFERCLDHMLNTENILNINSSLQFKSEKAHYEADVLKAIKEANEEANLMAHQTRIQNVEFADLICSREKVSYIVHAKMEFNNNMRDLAKQIQASMYVYEDMRQSGFKVTSDNHTINKIVDCIKNKEVIFVALLIINKTPEDKNVRKRLLESKSVIAKNCLNDLYKFSLKMGYKVRLLPVFADVVGNFKRKKKKYQLNII